MSLDVRADRGGIDKNPPAHADANQLARVKLAQHGAAGHTAEKLLRIPNRGERLEYLCGSLHATTVRLATVAIRENRKETLEEIHRRLFFEDTQPASEVLRIRIRECREAKGLTQISLAAAMTDVGVHLAGDMVSKIETGARSVSYDELLAFAYVLDVPLAELMSPPDGVPPIRAGGIGLEGYEVANWLVWGPSWGRKATHARKIIRLVGQVQTMCQVVLEERDAAGRKEHAETLKQLVTELSQAAGIRPGIMRRHSDEAA